MLLFEDLHWFKLLPGSYARKASNLNCWLEPEECVDDALQAAVRAVPALANANWQHLPFSLSTDWDKKLPIIPQEDGRLMEPIPSFAHTPDWALSGPDLLPKALPWPPPTSHVESWPLHRASIFSSWVPWALLLSGAEQRAQLSSSASVQMREGQLSHSEFAEMHHRSLFNHSSVARLESRGSTQLPGLCRLWSVGGTARVEAGEGVSYSWIHRRFFPCHSSLF